MADWLRILLAVLLPLSLLVGGGALGVWLFRIDRRYYAAFPERIPRGKRLVWRAVPFAALMFGMIIFFIHTENWPHVVLGVPGLGGFGWIIFKALTDPGYPKAPSRRF